MKISLKNVNLRGKSPWKESMKKISSGYYEFESIQPFFDGNGRVGRLIMSTQLLSKGYPPVLIRIEDQRNYHLGLTKGDNLMSQIICYHLERS